MLNPFTPRELATVLAALRYWQRHQAHIIGNSRNVLPEDDIATDGGTLAPLTRDEIDALCEAINTHAPAPAAVLAIVMDGGIVSDVVSNDPQRFAGVQVLTIDYDTDGASDEHLTPVPQGDGSLCPAYVHDETIDPAQINLGRLVEILEERVP